MPGTAVRYLELLELKGRGFVVLGAGQGIGAAAAHALAQAGATVLCVDSDEGRGSTFRILLPLRQVPAADVQDLAAGRARRA